LGDHLAGDGNLLQELAMDLQHEVVTSPTFGGCLGNMVE